MLEIGVCRFIVVERRRFIKIPSKHPNFQDFICFSMGELKAKRAARVTMRNWRLTNPA